MVAAVWVVGGPTDDDRNDLRHSLRSIATNAPYITEAWIVGDVPHWFAGTRMPLEPLAEKFANQRQSLTAFVNYPAAPAEFVLMNDDMFAIEPHTGVVTCRNKGRLSAWTAAEKADRKLNAWHRAVITTAEWVAKQVGPDPLIYECHTPLLFNTERLREAINDYPAGQPFAVGELYPIAGTGGEGKHRGNAKCAANDHLEHKLGLDMPYLSASPPTWAGAVGKHIRGMFPEACGWER